MSERRSPRFQLVVPIELLAKLREMASREHRSISNMIVVLIEEAIRERERKAEQGQWLPNALEAYQASATH